MLTCSSCIQVGWEKDKNEDKTEDTADEPFDPYPYEDLSVFMDLPEYKNLTIEKSKLDEMIKEATSSIVNENNLYVQVFDRAVKKWDKVVIDFVGMKDGVAFEGGSANNHELLIGSGSFIDGFEDGVIGMQIGESKDLKLKFPEDYYEDLAGKEVVFTVTLDEIWSPPEIDDKFCKDYTTFENAEEFNKYLNESCIFDYVWNKLMQQCTLKTLPDKEYTEYYQYFVGWFNSAAEEYNMPLENFLKIYGSYYSNYGVYSGMPMTEFYKLAENYAESNVVNDLLTYSLMRAEGIQLEGEEFEAAKAILVSENQKSYEDMLDEFGVATINISIINIMLAKRLTSYTLVK